MAGELNGERLEQLMRQHAAALELFAAQWTSTPEDCVQEAFVRLMRQSVAPEHVVSWLYRVVRNQAISTQRSWWRRRRREAAFAAERPAWFDSDRLTSVEVEELTDALRSLTPELREVVVARIWGGLSFDQIGTAVGVSVSTVHRRYQAGLQAVRRKLEQPCPSTNPSSQN